MTKTCQYLFGVPKDRNFCGEPVLIGQPYCEKHFDLCHKPWPIRAGDKPRPKKKLPSVIGEGNTWNGRRTL